VLIGKIGNTMKWIIKQLLNSVLEKYRDLLASRRSIIRPIIDLLAHDKSRYFNLRNLKVLQEKSKTMSMYSSRIDNTM
jgi:hypothetical protein